MPYGSATPNKDIKDMHGHGPQRIIITANWPKSARLRTLAAAVRRYKSDKLAYKASSSPKSAMTWQGPQYTGSKATRMTKHTSPGPVILRPELARAMNAGEV